MARYPLLTLSDIALTYGGDPILSGVDLTVHPGDRMALVGRNGSGKSTLMKIMAGLTHPDGGSCVLGPGLSVGYMEQDPDFAGFATLGDYTSATLGASEQYRVDKAATGLNFAADQTPETASGGERRRAALARIIAEDPDLMLLDEPTNHLDIAAINWLENHLAGTKKAFLLISHDRAFLRALTRATLWVDRGRLRRQDKGFDAFEGWRDTVFAEEDLTRHKLNRLIKSEGRWAVEGISARRKRNQGRVRRLADLRQQRADQIKRQGAAGLQLEAGSQSGKLVIEASAINHGFDGIDIVRAFSLKVMRGDRVAVVGPNGVGKTTLIDILTGARQPDSGTVRLGVNLLPVVFDQNRTALDPDVSLWDSLTLDRELGVSGKNDQIMVRGQARHVVGYLKEFLFDESQARAPVRALSGGEKARLLLARLMARDSNLLVLDEPTNDLDVETLDLLQEALDGFDGTVLLVSHDRDFIDRVATTTVAMEGDGQATVYAGGWSDYRAQRSANEPVGKPAQAVKSASKTIREGGPARAHQRARLSYRDARALAALPAEIARLAGEVAQLETLLGDPDLFTKSPDKFARAGAALVARRASLTEAEDEWLRLEELAETLE